MLAGAEASAAAGAEAAEASAAGAAAGAGAGAAAGAGAGAASFLPQAARAETAIRDASRMECFMCVLETMKLTEMQGVSTPRVTVSPQTPGLDVHRSPRDASQKGAVCRKPNRFQYNRYQGLH
ncbi:MAG: hypothetical protein EBR46_01990 [Betaproteobacteria bacterium]|nr:hypothetical protein [Betaproteobacteria bacterium]